MDKRLFLAPLVILSLAACSHEKPKFICPQTAIIHDLERVNDYGREEHPGPDDLVAGATLKSLSGDCTYEPGDKDKANDPDRGMSVDFTLKASALRGPHMGSGEVVFPYFIAIVDPDQKVIGKELQTLSFKFSSDLLQAENEEELHVFLPLQSEKDAQDYRVLVGFQLTERQLHEKRGEGR
jgi:hypothetical protein